MTLTKETMLIGGDYHLRGNDEYRMMTVTTLLLKNRAKLEKLLYDPMLLIVENIFGGAEYYT